MQIFILLYIEAGSYIDVDQSWDFAVLWVNLLTVRARVAYLQTDTRRGRESPALPHIISLDIHRFTTSIISLKRRV